MEAAGLTRHPAHASRSSEPPRPSGWPRSPARRTSRSSATRRRWRAALSPVLAAARTSRSASSSSVDTGFARTGVQTPEAAAELAVLVDSLPGLRFDGLMTYPTLPETRPVAARRPRGDPGPRPRRCERVSARRDADLALNHSRAEITEVRAGTYVYGDRSCIANGSVPLEDCALRIRATVVSRPTAERGHPGRRLEDADERPGRGGERGRPRPDRRVPGRADLRALRGARPRRPRRLPPSGRRSARSSRSSRTTPAAARTCTTRSPFTAAAGIVGLWPVAARGKLR